jgi:hypothetical protein
VYEVADAFLTFVFDGVRGNFVTCLQEGLYKGEGAVGFAAPSEGFDESSSRLLSGSMGG